MSLILKSKKNCKNFKVKSLQSQLGSCIVCSVIYTTTGHRLNELENGLEIE